MHRCLFNIIPCIELSIPNELKIVVSVHTFAKDLKKFMVDSRLPLFRCNSDFLYFTLGLLTSYSYVMFLTVINKISINLHKSNKPSRETLKMYSDSYFSSSHTSSKVLFSLLCSSITGFLLTALKQQLAKIPGDEPEQ